MKIVITNKIIQNNLFILIKLIVMNLYLFSLNKIKLEDMLINLLKILGLIME